MTGELHMYMYIQPPNIHCKLFANSQIYLKIMATLKSVIRPIASKSKMVRSCVCVGLLEGVSIIGCDEVLFFHFHSCFYLHVHTLESLVNESHAHVCVVLECYPHSVLGIFKVISPCRKLSSARLVLGTH